MKVTFLLPIVLAAATAQAFAEPESGGSSKADRAKWTRGAAAALDDLLISNPSNVVANATQAATQSSTTEVGRVTSAGAPSVDKGVTAPAAWGGPEVYLEFEWSHIQDLTVNGPDGDRFGPVLGADWSTPDGFVFGGAVSYAAERRITTDVSTRSNDFIFAAYAGKNFADWINVGATFVYDYQTRIIKSFQLRADGHNHTLGVSPFVGVAHAWGNFSFASTATYIYQYNSVSLPTNTNNINLSESFGSSGYLHINEFSYSVTDKFTVSLLANINVEIEQERSTYTKTIDISDPFFMTWGTRFAYQADDRWRIYGQFQADTFNKNFEVFTTTAGLSLSF